MKQTTAQFDFVAKPKVTSVKPKYRQRQEQRTQPLSLMNDPRIVRGNTYAAIVANKNEIIPPALKKTIKQNKRPRQRRINFDTGFQPATPRAVDGRDHFTTQTQPFVETLRDKPIQYEKESQTDFFLDRPAEREFDPMKGKTGVDRNTQIQENDPQLFNFDYEVQPIVEALLNKILQTSRTELHEQDLLKVKEAEKMNYQRQRHVRLVQTQKLQANETRLKEQYDRRQLQHHTSKQQQKFTQKKVISRILSKQYLKNLKGNTCMVLNQEGFFRQPLQTDLYNEYTPWLYRGVLQELKKNKEFGKEVEAAILEAKEERIREAKAVIDKEKTRRQTIINEKQSKQTDKLQRRESKRKQKEQEEIRKRAQKEEQERAQNQGAVGEAKQEEVPQV